MRLRISLGDMMGWNPSRCRRMRLLLSKWKDSRYAAIGPIGSWICGSVTLFKFTGQRWIPWRHSLLERLFGLCDTRQGHESGSILSESRSRFDKGLCQFCVHLRSRGGAGGLTKKRFGKKVQPKKNFVDQWLLLSLQPSVMG